MVDVIKAEGLVKTYGAVRALDGLDLTVAEGTVLGGARAQRRGQDHRGAHPDHVARRRRRHGRGRGLRRAHANRATCARTSASPASTPRSTSTSPASRTCAWSAGCTASTAKRSKRSRDELLEQFALTDAGRPSGQAPTPAACAVASTSPARWCAARRCCSSTSRPPASTRAAAPRCGRSSPSSSATAPRCCSPRSTSRRPTGSPTTSSSSTTARAIARGTADELKAAGRRRAHRGRRRLGRRPRRSRVRPCVRSAIGEVIVDEHTRRLTAPVRGGAGALVEALRNLDAAEVAVLDVGLRRPTLDDVFLTLTGHARRGRPAAAAGEPAEQDERVPDDRRCRRR